MTGDVPAQPAQDNVEATSQPRAPALELAAATGTVLLHTAAASDVELPPSVTASDDGSSDHLMDILHAGGRMHLPYAEVVVREWLALRCCTLPADVWADGVVAEGESEARLESLTKCLRVRVCVSPLAPPISAMPTTGGTSDDLQCHPGGLSLCRLLVLQLSGHTQS